MNSRTDNLCVNSIRTLAIDMIGKANSGHPGLPLGASPLAYTLWSRHLRFSPECPEWINRDRFVLSAGHGSAMLYAMLHLYGFGLTMDDLKNFRQLGSLTPGHPEYRHTKGVEMTTGPLGQGFATAVGMALAERILAQKVNKDGAEPLINHYTYTLAGDGCLMEGISYEAASIAGQMKLNKLICLYDSNGITIEGSTQIAFTENVKERFLAQNWNVIEVADGNDIEEIDAAISKAKQSQDKPTIIIAKTHIGFGSPKQDKAAVHGEPLKPEEILATKEKLGWPSKEPFFVPEEARNEFAAQIAKGNKYCEEWKKLQEKYANEYPENAEMAKKLFSNEIPEGLFNPEDSFFEKPVATREASGKAINLIAKAMPGLAGGAADLGPSTKTDITVEPGRTLHYGIREHAMGALINGMAVHGGLIPYGATFMVFSDYVRPALRLAAMMQIPSIFVFTHDSIGVGEDGPTHQPIEHLMSMRLIPGLTVLRPADAWETLYAWEAAVRNGKPVCLALSRQKLPLLTQYRSKIAEGLKKGAYILYQSEIPVKVELAGTGSEVHILFEAAKILEEKGIGVKIISVPSFELFNEQTEEYRKSVFSDNLPKVSAEAGRTIGWKDFFGSNSASVGIDRYGASGPASKVYAELGVTAENVVKKAMELL